MLIESTECFVLWCILIGDALTMELTNGIAQTYVGL